jgi:hypothetical protein
MPEPHEKSDVAEIALADLRAWVERGSLSA